LLGKLKKLFWALELRTEKSSYWLKCAEIASAFCSKPRIFIQYLKSAFMLLSHSPNFFIDLTGFYAYRSSSQVVPKPYLYP
jgi:hypothetical protein